MSLSVSELSSENLRTCFQIINAYVYLSATEFLQVRRTKPYCMSGETLKYKEMKTLVHMNDVQYNSHI